MALYNLLKQVSDRPSSGYYLTSPMCPIYATYRPRPNRFYLIIEGFERSDLGYIYGISSVFTSELITIFVVCDTLLGLVYYTGKISAIGRVVLFIACFTTVRQKLAVVVYVVPGDKCGEEGAMQRQRGWETNAGLHRNSIEY